MFGNLSCGEASGASCGFSVDTGIGGLNLMSMGSCGVEGCGADEVLEVVYWVCVVVLPIGLSCLV